MSTGSFVTIGSNIYPLPDSLDINPILILDEENAVYRISLGKPDMTHEDMFLYTPLFEYIDTHMPFIEDMYFAVDGETLRFKLAYIEKNIKGFGIFYDIEAATNEIIWNERKSIHGSITG